MNRKKPRFEVLADFDEGNEGCSAEFNEDDILETSHHSKSAHPSKNQSYAEKERQLTEKRIAKFGPPSITIRKTILFLDNICEFAQSFAVPAEVLRPKWIRYTNVKKPRQLIFCIVDCSDAQMYDEKNELTFLNEFFKRSWTAVSDQVRDRANFWKQMMTVTVSKETFLRELVKNSGDPLRHVTKTGDLKRSLITTVEEMTFFRYPLPGYEVEAPPGLPPIVPTREIYAHLSATSPIFILDCEMCVTENRLSELTRVTMIDEEGRIVLDTFVKPATRIIDYVTCYSGISKECLEGVDITLQDVQAAFRRILPPDAILCGHSIDNDLKALRMSHPYCLDVGLAYNMTNRRSRTALRSLMYYFFNETIQTSTHGHCSYEDAYAALRLLKLKLENGYEFGNIAKGFDYAGWAKARNYIINAAKFQENAITEKPYNASAAVGPARVVGKCKGCGLQLKTFCRVDICPCASQPRHYCCKCVGKDNVFEEPVNGFNFGKAVNVSTTNKITMNEALKKSKKGRIMVARYFDQPSDCNSGKYIRMFDMTQQKTLDSICSRILDSNVLSHDLCLIEYNARNLPASDLDEFLKSVHKCVCKAGLMAVLMNSPSKTVMYLNVKPF